MNWEAWERKSERERIGVGVFRGNAPAPQTPSSSCQRTDSLVIEVYGMVKINSIYFLIYFTSDRLKNLTGHFGERIDDNGSCCLVGAEVARTALSVCIVGACWFSTCLLLLCLVKPGGLPRFKSFQGMLNMGSYGGLSACKYWDLGAWAKVCVCVCEREREITPF